METINTLGPGMNNLRPELEDLDYHIIVPGLTERIPDEGLAAHAKEVFGQPADHIAVVRVRWLLPVDLGRRWR